MARSISWTRSVHGYSMLIALMVAAMALSLLAGAAHAASPSGGGTDSFSYTMDGTSAYTSSYECTTSKGITTCTGTDLYVFDGTVRDSEVGRESGTRVCASVYTESYSGRRYISSTYESGCTMASSGSFTVAKDLSSATLAPTTVTLETVDCTYDEATGEETCVVTSSRDVVVSAEFTGVGPLYSSSNRGKFSDGTCTETYSSRGTSRDAEATFTVDGKSYSGQWGYLESGRFSFKVSCR